MCAPKPPSVKATAAAQTGTNVSTAIANAQLNNVNEVGPDGNLTYTNTGTYDFTDPSTGQTFHIPKTTATTTLSPAQQAIKEQADQTALGLNTLANKQTGFLQGYMDHPFTFDDQAHTTWATDEYKKLHGEDFADQLQQAQSRLSNMGIKMGTPAYDREISRLEKSQGQQYDQFALDSYGQDFATQQALRNQPLNEIASLRTGSQVAQPIFNHPDQGTIPTTDIAGIINNNYAQQVAASNANGSNIGGVLSGIGSALPFVLSDERAKKNIKKIGTENGQAIHTYNYKGEPKGSPIRMGLVAQKVERKTPEAVVTGRDGLKRVNYAKAMAMGRKAA